MADSMKLTVRQIASFNQEIFALCTEDGTVLPMQLETSISSSPVDGMKIVATFLIDGEDVKLIL